MIISDGLHKTSMERLFVESETFHCWQLEKGADQNRLASKGDV